MPNLVEDVRALTAGLLKASGGSKFTLVAHDWGGVVAWVFAAQHPEMLDKLVILNAPHPSLFGRELLTNPEQQKASEYMLMFRSAEAEALLSEDSYAWLKRAVLGSQRHRADDTAMYVDAWSQPGALTGGLNYYRAAAVGPPPPGASPASRRGVCRLAARRAAGSRRARSDARHLGREGHGPADRQSQRTRSGRADAHRHGASPMGLIGSHGRSRRK